ncbi:MAG: polysaccharide pyruvyl transferase family protein [Sphaerochaeta sp.]|uniref:polysaccharide pyruvyl transferase family protein n=1 Tax=Sphaerochaeta sp. TaxID=1972642 RepID=UPI003D107C94
MKSNYKALTSNTIVFTVGNIGAKLISFLLVPLYTNVLSTADYGITELMLSSVNLLIPILTVSIQDAVLRFGLEKAVNKGEVLKNAVIILTASSCCVLLALPLIRMYRVLADWYVFFAVITILQMFRTVLSVYLKAIEKNKAYAFQSLLFAISLAMFNLIFLLWFNMGIAGYFYAMILALLITIIFIVISGGVIYGVAKSQVNRELLVKMIRFSIPMILNAISWWLVTSSNRFLIEHFMSSEDVGLYSAAAKIPALLAVFTGIFQSAWTISAITEYDSSNNKSFFSNVFSAFSFLQFIASSCIIMVIQPFMSIYVGNSFFSSWIYVSFLLVGTLFHSYSFFFGSIYTAAKKNVMVGLTTLCGAVVSIITNIILIPKVGIWGAVIATIISHVSIAVFRMINSRKYFAFTVNYIRILLATLVLLLQCFMSTFSGYPVLTSIPCIAIMLVIYRKDISWAANLIRKQLLMKHNTMRIEVAVMKKVGIVTYSGNNNAGSFLQCFATQKILQHFCYTGVLLRRTDKVVVKVARRIWRELISFIKCILHPRNTKTILQRGKSASRVQKNDQVSSKFETSFKNTINILNISTLRLRKLAKSQEYIAFISGSDQIWNPSSLVLDKYYFLRFVPRKKRIAFAPSLGVTEIPDYNRHAIKKYVSEYAALSVRETSGAIILRDLLQADVTVIPDPVLVLPASQWRDEVRDNGSVLSCVAYNRAKYVLLYFLDEPNSMAVQLISEISNDNGIDIVLFNSDYEILHATNNITRIIGNPFDFVGLIDCALLVMTDSFHATAFSVKMNTPFYCFQRQYGHGFNQSTRIESFLKLVGHENRFISSRTECPKVVSPYIQDMNFARSNSVLDEEAKKALEYLKAALQLVTE